eukprot:98478_1
MMHFLQSIIAVITFKAYTNQTRFAWAYPALALDRVYRIPPGTMMLATAIAGVLYLNFYTIMDYISERQYFDVNTKILYVILILGLLYGLNQTESMEAPVLGEDDKEYTKSIKSAKPYLGMLMLTFSIVDQDWMLWEMQAKGIGIGSSRVYGSYGIDYHG